MVKEEGANVDDAPTAPLLFSDLVLLLETKGLLLKTSPSQSTSSLQKTPVEIALSAAHKVEVYTFCKNITRILIIKIPGPEPHHKYYEIRCFF